jgi:hypothetical protein
MAVPSGDLLGDDTKDRYLRSDLLDATLRSNREVDVTFYGRRTKIFFCAHPPKPSPTADSSSTSRRRTIFQAG